MGVTKYSPDRAHWNYTHRILRECRDNSPYEILHKTLNASGTRHFYDIAALKQDIFCLMLVNRLQVNCNLSLIRAARDLPDNSNLLFITIRQCAAGHCDRMRDGGRFL